MAILKDLWNVLVIGACIVYFGGVAGLAYTLGSSALDLHQKGFFSLAKYNRALVGPTK